MQHLTGVYSSPYYSIYTDAIEVPGLKLNKDSFKLANVMRSSNYIGRNNWGIPNANVDINDLNIINRYLSQDEIQFEISNNIS